MVSAAPASHSTSDGTGVEDRDDEDRADVVDDREGEQEELQPGRDARAEQREHSDRERDIGRHRDAPPAAAGAARVPREEHERRHDHAADGREERQARGAAVA